MNVFFLFAGLVLGMVLHEAGHAAAAVALGFRVRRVTVGSGTVLLRLRLGSAWVVLRALPLGGAVHMLARRDRHSVATALMLLGGVAGNVALLALSVILSERLPGWRGPLLMVAWVQVIVVVLNLVPRKLEEDDSDGLALLKLLRRPSDAAAELGRFWAQFVCPADAPPLLVTEKLAELSYQALCCLADPDAWARRDALRVLQRLLHSGGLSPPERAAVLGTLVLDGRDADPAPGAAQLDAWTVEGMELAPTPWMQAARAHALAALGRHKEAMDLAAAASATPLPQDAAVASRLLVAEIAARLGDAGNALAWLAQAREMAAKATPPLQEAMDAAATRVAATNAILAGYGQAYLLVNQLIGPPGVPIEPPSPFFPKISEAWTRANDRADPDAMRQACAAFQPLLQQELPAVERAFVLGCLAINGLTHETGATDEELDRWSAEALALAPTDTLRVVRAGVLVHLGQCADGMRMALAASVLRTSERALAYVFASRAAARLDEPTAAAAWLDLARTTAGSEAELRAAAGRLVDAAEGVALGKR